MDTGSCAPAEPAVYATSGVWGRFAPRTAAFPELERGLDQKYEWVLFNQAWQPWYGLLDHGQVMVSYDDSSWKDWGNNEPAQDFLLWLQFVRTGDARFFDAPPRMSLTRVVPCLSVANETRLQGDRALIKTKDAKTQVAQDFAMHALGSLLAGASQGRSSGRTIQQHRPTTHSINEALDVFVVARRGATFQPDVGVQKIPLDKKEPFQKVSDETLNVEFSPVEAVEKARGLAFDDVRARYLSVSNFNVTATPVGEPELIYTPWWVPRI